MMRHTVLKTNGQIAFEAYAHKAGWKTNDGKPIPYWDNLSQEVREAWEAAAEAVARQFDWMIPKRKGPKL